MECKLREKEEDKGNERRSIGERLIARERGGEEKSGVSALLTI